MAVVASRAVQKTAIPSSEVLWVTVFDMPTTQHTIITAVTAVLAAVSTRALFHVVGGSIVYNEPRQIL